MRARVRRFTLFIVASIGLSIAASAFAQVEIKPPERRIVGGDETDIKQHPWQVALRIQINGILHLCGGSIIAPQWILTAAHCFAQTTTPGDVRVKAGATDYVSDGVWMDVVRIVIHGRYNANTYEHDIALVKLEAEWPDKIPLADASLKIPLGQLLEVTGWGATAEGGTMSEVLLKGTVPYAENAACNGPAAFSGKVKEGMICAEYRDGGADSCQGDSGGPLVWHRSDEDPVLVGIVSWGRGCARPHSYGVYTRVSHYRDWIERMTGQGN